MAFPTKASRPLWQSLPRTTLSLSPDSTGERIDVPDNGIDALTRLEVCEQANLLSQHCRSLSERDQALINSVLDHIPIVDWSRIAESLDIATADAARSRWFRIRQNLRR